MPIIEPKFFFDLEETIIKSWDDPSLCNVHAVKKFISEHSIKEISIFSAAVWNERDNLRFKNEMHSWLESVFDVKIIDCISMEEVWKKTSWKTVKFESVQEMIVTIGKKRMFEDWCFEVVGDNSHSILLDDSFGNTSLINHDRNIRIDTIDVTKLSV